MSDNIAHDIKPNVETEGQDQLEEIHKFYRAKKEALQAKVKPGKRSTPKAVAVGKAAKEGYNPTTKAMAYDWVMKALDNVTPDMKKELAAELGVKQGNLINSWNNNWKKRVEKVLSDEFRGGA